MCPIHSIFAKYYRDEIQVYRNYNQLWSVVRYAKIGAGPITL